MKYRWLDLRREHMQRNIRVRAQLVRIIREEMEREGFVDIETPMLWKPTPEGARDFVVPSRLQPGKFYALPQSPQIAKQLLVISGFERYYQIARCMRDEDPRADRLQELTQLDVELAFPDREFLFALMERIVARIWRECIDVELETPFQRMTYDEAMLRFGIDRPDLRFGMEIQDVTADTRDVGVRRVRERARRALHRRAEGAVAHRGAGAREPGEVVGRQGSRVRRLPRRRRDLVADREVPRARAARALATAGPHAALRRRRPARRREGARPAANAARPRARARRRVALEVPLGRRHARRGVGRAGRSAGSPRTIRSRARPTTASRSSRPIPAPRARSRTTSSATGSSWPAARSGSTSRGCSSRSSRTSASARRSSVRSSASCSTRSRWARRRTAASRRGSTG